MIAMDAATLFTKSLALFTLFGNVASVALLLSYFLARPIYRHVMDILGRYALMLGFLLSGASTVGSLIYSEVVGFPACILCWTQRIFMYPQMFIFGLAIWRNEKVIMVYTLMLSLIGGAVGLYQWIKDMLSLYSDVTLPCSAVTALPSCDKMYVLEYGYITIPMISLNAFVLIIIVMYAGLKRMHHAK